MQENILVKGISMEYFKCCLLACLILIPLSSYSEKKTPEQKLGRLLFTDKSLSLYRNQSCESCHSLKRLKIVVNELNDDKNLFIQPAPSFAHPDNIRHGSVVAEGSVHGRFGTLNTPALAYGRFSPFFRWDNQFGWLGGVFWDGRAKNLSDQAGKPILNPLEMAMPSKWAVASRLQENPKYVKKFRKIYDLDIEAIPSYELAPRNITPPPGVFSVFDALSKALASFQNSSTFNKFNSKYDYVIAGQTNFNDKEKMGFELFNGKAQCARCHFSSMGNAPDGSEFPALFSSYTYLNIGAPYNINIQNQPPPHPGIGGREEVKRSDKEGKLLGAFKVPTLRNVALTPPYMHNGVLSSLNEVVHFYNSRDTKFRVCTSVNDAGFSIGCWPTPEFPESMVFGAVGDLELSAEEEASIVAFLHTLTDNYPVWGNINGLDDPNVPPGTPSPFTASIFP